MFVRPNSKKIIMNENFVIAFVINKKAKYISGFFLQYIMFYIVR